MALPPRLTTLAATQHGLLRRPQLLDAGVAPATITRWCRDGRLGVIGSGLYRIAGTPETYPQRVMAGCLATDGLASHRSAAVLCGLSGFQAELVEVTARSGRRAPTTVDRLHQTRDLEARRGRPRHGVPCVRPTRLALDLAAHIPTRDLTVARFDDAIEELVRRRLTDWRSLARAARQGRDERCPGAAHLHDIVAEYLDDGAESRLERRFLQVVRTAGLPEPVPQVRISDGDGFIARVDFAWPEAKVAAELDSRRHHLTAAAFENDRIKRERLRRAGWWVLELTHRRLRDDPEPVMVELAELLAHRSLLGG